MKSVTLDNETNVAICGLPDNETVAAICGLPLVKTYLDYADSDTDNDQRYVIRDGFLVRVLVANSGCVNDLFPNEAKVLAEVIKTASEDAEKFLRTQQEFAKAQFANLNCELEGTLQSSTFNFRNPVNRIIYSVKLKISDGRRVCSIRSIDREGNEKLLHSSTSTDMTISEKAAGIELKAYLLKQVKDNDNVVPSEGV